MGVSKNNGTPKWMVYFMENPMNKWMIWAHPYFWKHPYIHLLHLKISAGEPLRSTPGCCEGTYQTGWCNSHWWRTPTKWGAWNHFVAVCDFFTLPKLLDQQNLNSTDILPNTCFKPRTYLQNTNRNPRCLPHAVYQISPRLPSWWVFSGHKKISLLTALCGSRSWSCFWVWKPGNFQNKVKLTVTGRLQLKSMCLTLNLSMSLLKLIELRLCWNYAFLTKL